MSDIYNLQRFLDAQDSIYEEVLKELKQGRKTSHWMWYIFPQIKGLGRTATAQKFAISSLEEAQAYLKDPILGSRLRECTHLVLDIENRDIQKIFGYPDYLKFRSSITLFLETTKDNKIFQDVLLKYFAGQPDQLTLDIIS